MYRLTLLLLPLCAGLACNSTSSATSSTTSGSTTGSPAGSTGGSTSGSSGGTTTGAALPAVGCTSDLRSTVDANGNVVATCLPSQGCQAGACVDACAAAAAAKGSVGCDFYAPDTPFVFNGSGGSSYDGPCYAALVANPWPQAAHLSVDYGGTASSISAVAYIPTGIAPNVSYTPVDAAAGLAPGQVAVLFLSADPNSSTALSALTCPQNDAMGNPIVPAVAADAAVQGSGAGTAFHLSSDTPVQVQDILPYGGPNVFLPGASLLFPSSAWGGNYVVASPLIGTSAGVQWLMAVGQTDSTTLTVNSPTTLTGGGTVASCVAGTPTTFTINRGQILQWVGADPGGAIVVATQPVAIFTGNTDLNVANDYGTFGGGDGTHQQLPPVAAEGSVYVAPGYSTREPNGKQEKIPYTFVGAVDGTSLTYDPGPPAGAPTTLNAGQSVEFASGSTFAVASQDAAHPFLVTQYMSGAWDTTVAGCNVDAGNLCGLGDEEWVVLPPVAQFEQRYVFGTDPTYATTNLTLIRQRTDGGFAPVNVGCLGGKVIDWATVGDGGQFQVAYVDLYRGGVGVGSCGTSAQEADSNAPFGAMVWGTDSYVSYAYAAGASLAPLNSVVVAP